MSFLSNAFNDAASSLGFGSFSAQANSRYAANLQKELWNYQMSNAHQLEVQDLRAAGLNPILSALGNSSYSMPSVSTTSANSTGTDSGVKNALAFKQLAIEKTNADTKKIEAEASKKNADTNAAAQVSQASVNNSIVGLNSINSQIASLDLKAKPDLIAKQLEEMASRISANVAATNSYNASSAASLATAAHQSALVSVAHASTDKLVKEGKLTDAQAEKLINYNKFDSRHPDLYGFSQMLKRLSEGVGLGELLK